jgi:predicted transcriptional regulator
MKNVLHCAMAVLQPAIFDEIDEVAEAEADARAEADVRAGRVISHEAMKTWLLSWGRVDELPPPEVGS